MQSISSSTAWTNVPISKGRKECLFNMMFLLEFEISWVMFFAYLELYLEDRNHVERIHLFLLHDLCGILQWDQSSRDVGWD